VAVTVISSSVAVPQLKSTPLYKVFTVLLILMVLGAVMLTDRSLAEIHELASLL
jgi:hypothetical protein